MTLQECDFRCKTENESVYYCRHSSVHTLNDLVSDEICNICEFANTQCRSPRPEPSKKKSQLPPLRQQVWNLTKSLADFSFKGFKTVSKRTYQKRLEICDTCDERQDNRCLKCGCYLSKKAIGLSFSCPLNKWESLIDKSDK